ncbi:MULTISPECIES: PAAR domain-containing protein [Klebsiella]|uniref:PAAR domain-containing protein n=2 Tax=Klebsiella pneumoniae complex TaxID=3390273 RepID=A0AAN1Y4C3_9ENTR|nr:MULTISPECIES: PAAR domain-containing protein [Klebsiella]EKY4128345.1 PAAR domain-containing protein [Klebsiella quasipneumoniae]EMB9112428.1 PAAR domain-containing protein [Klebsiella quasipneumoniae]EME4044674.1 PAAR domain-containing protein [Klebsiella quasipneumoniae]MBC4923769.1 PAAR domain-containing protein [Klebsiella quasipneumoniae]MBY5242267.1 PAAR domain-containing protein [Klebsiella quasipneumoniae]
MKKTICVGDKTSHGGSVLTGSPQITIDGKSVARKSDLVSCPTHGLNNISEGDENHCDNGLAIALEGHRCACGAILISSGSRVLKE